MDAVLARIVAREQERETRRSAIIYPVGYVPRKCAVCGEHHAPFGNADGRWFCGEHRPLPLANDNQNNILPQSNAGVVAPFPESDQGNLVIENIVTGVITRIDLNAKPDTLQFNVAPKGPRRERTFIEPVLPADYADPLIDWEALEDDARNQNALAEAAHVTDRFCRCGSLADIGFRIDKQIVWRCHECRGGNLEG